jgi:hypothetical protein
MFSMILVSFAALLPWFPVEAAFPPGGVNKSTFDKIKVGMTPEEIQALIRRGKARYLFWRYGYSEMKLWTDSNDTKRIWVEYEPTVAAGKVTRASFVDYSTTPFTEFELRRVATKEECATVIDQLLADGLTKEPLEHSDAFTKAIPVDGPRATRAIQDDPDHRSYYGGPEVAQ